MLIDNAAEINRTPSRYDVCVIGAGAAGITLALKLAANGKRVALCEGGGLEYTDPSQECYLGEVIGDPYFDLDIARLRYFGGTTNHWVGLSRIFEPQDFDRGYMGPEYAWPISAQDLARHLPEASEILEIPTTYSDMVRNEKYGIKSVEFQLSPPVRFAEKYLAEIQASRRIDLYINANLVDLEVENRRVTSASFANYNAQNMRVDADSFVFAMGGIENSRQLLWLRERYGNLLAAAELPIGRYWMEHPHFTLGDALVPRSVSNNRYYAMTAKAERDLGVFGCGFRVERQGGSFTQKLVRELMCVAPSVGEWAAGLAGQDRLCGVRFRAAWEQAPDFDNRVALSKSTQDMFGIPRAELHWRKTELDHRTVQLSANQFNLWLLEDDLGRVRLDEWVYTDKEYPQNDELAGFHHMGGTRMAASARLGVVDADCKVFGTQNLFMAGSSVFSTGGYNNPTLPIVQLALRLGEHLSV